MERAAALERNKLALLDAVDHAYRKGQTIPYINCTSPDMTFAILKVLQTYTLEQEVRVYVHDGDWRADGDTWRIEVPYVTTPYVGTVFFDGKISFMPPISSVIAKKIFSKMK